MSFRPVATFTNSPRPSQKGFVVPKTTTNTSSTETRTSTPRGGGGRSRMVRGRGSYRTGAFEVFAYPHHSMPAVVCGAVWRWRIELLVVTTVVVVWVVLAYQLPASWPTWSPPVVLATTVAAIGWCRCLAGL